MRGRKQRNGKGWSAGQHWIEEVYKCMGEHLCAPEIMCLCAEVGKELSEIYPHFMSVYALK